MRLLLLILLLPTTSYAKLKVEVLQGFATHYTKSDNYNDRHFKDNLTSTISLLRVSYKEYGLTGLSDSQGKFSVAATYTKKLYTYKKLNLEGVVGTYILRNDGKDLFKGEGETSLPYISLNNRKFAITPLLGVQFNVKLYKELNFTALLTPGFTLWGLKYGF